MVHKRRFYQLHNHSNQFLLQGWSFWPLEGLSPSPLVYATVEINKLVTAVVPLTLQVTKITIPL